MSGLTSREFAAMYQDLRGGRLPGDEFHDVNAQLHAHVFDPSAAEGIRRNLGFDGGAQALGTLTQVAKAIHRTNQAGQRLDNSGMLTLREDPLTTWTDVPGTVPRVGRVPAAMLRTIAEKNPVIAAILQVMRNRAVRHTRHVESGMQAMLTGAEGFDVVPTYKGLHEPLTEAEVREKAEIVSFLKNGGDAPRFTLGDAPNREDAGRESFAQIMAQIVNQRFITDAVAIEIQRSRNGRKLKGLYVADGATIARVDRRAWPYGEIPEAHLDPKAAFVQVWRNQIVSVIGSNDLLYDYFNPRDAIGTRGYGISETEISLRLTTGILNILTSNNAIFDRGAVPPGILYLMGNIGSNDLLDWQQDWDTYRLGAGGAHALPALNIKDPQGKIGFLRTDAQASEMQFSGYSNFLGALQCATFGIDCSEINFSAYGGNNASLSSGKDSQTKIDETKNRAFTPLLLRQEENFNEILEAPYGGRWRLQFVGVVKHDTKEMRETFLKVATVDETRQALFNMQPIGGLAGGSIVGNPSIAQMTLAAIKDGAADSNGDGQIQAKEISGKESSPAKSDRPKLGA